jgi:hypothetical protein
MTVGAEDEHGGLRDHGDHGGSKKKISVISVVSVYLRAFI